MILDICIELEIVGEEEDAVQWKQTQNTKALDVEDSEESDEDRQKIEVGNKLLLTIVSVCVGCLLIYFYSTGIIDQITNMYTFIKIMVGFIFQESVEPVKKRRHRKSKSVAAAVDPQEEKKKRLMDPYPLSVSVTLRAADEGLTLKMLFYYLPVMHIITVRSSVTCPTSITSKY